MTSIVVYLQGEEVHRHVIDRPIMTIGRGKSNDVLIRNPGLSRFHAQLERQPDGYILRDLGSQNGTFLNGKKVIEPNAITTDDEVMIGKHSLKIQRDKHIDPAPLQEARQNVFVLVVQAEGIEAQSFALLGDTLILGRSDDADVTLPSKQISRRHLVLTRQEGGFLAQDQGSQNGTYVNKRRISEPTFVKAGDALFIAPYALFLTERELDLPAPEQTLAGDAPPEQSPDAFNPHSTMLLSAADLKKSATKQEQEEWDAQLRDLLGDSSASGGFEPVEPRDPGADEAWDDRTGAAAPAFEPPRDLPSRPPLEEAAVQAAEEAVQQPVLSVLPAATSSVDLPPGTAILSQGVDVIMTVTMDQSALVVGDTERCDIVLNAGEIKYGPAFALVVTQERHLCLVKLGQFAPSAPAIQTLAPSEQVTLENLTITWDC